MPDISRKTLLKAALVAAPLPFVAGQFPARATVTPTPSCDDGDDLTPDQTEGPYFKPNSPERTVLTGPGTPLTVSGFVFGMHCLPLANVLMDFWQADTYGNYDNVGYTFRGHQYTNAQGAFNLTTIVPGLYPGRTRHIHVKVQAPHQPILTTQLYFPGEPRNNTDTIFNPALLMNVRTVGSGKEGTFDFILNVQGTPPTTPTPPPGGTWQAGKSYQTGDQVTYGGATYRCLQSHTAQPGWEPPNVPALWQRL
ncbi:carbohydrate-binding protein [Nonomuraea sediminis]|uniref:carbohydrate-binding protein n=1 Tax=Nonomuraea sediminis TaxID=2835864 RepID=UPI001BDBCF1A|nr:carbohydrate-binding protein [Nonomuraea sediminis]